jgi:hypothetical protein
VTTIENKPIGWLGWLWRAAIAAILLVYTIGDLEGLASMSARNGLDATQSLGVVFGPSAVREPRWLGVAQVEPGGGAAAAGIRPGDAVRFDALLGQEIGWRPGERVTITVSRGGKRFPATVVARAPDFYASGSIVTLAAIVQFLGAAGFGAVLLVRGWRNRAALQLATILPLIFGRAPALWLPHPAAAGLMLALAPAKSLISLIWLTFCLEISGGPSSGRQGRWVLGAGLAICAMSGYGLLADLVPLPLPGAGPALGPAAILAANVLGYAILAANYRGSDAPARNRIKIVILAFVCIVLAALVLGAADALSSSGKATNEQLWLWGACVVLIYLALILLAYAVLRRRLFDLGFALNRTLVFGAVSFILLAAFGLGEWGADRLIPESWRGASAIYSAGIALVLFLSFHRLRDAVERQVERLFFHRWQQNEAALRRFVASAGHFHQTPALCRAFAEEATRFCEGAPAALYLRAADGGYRLQAGSLSGAAPGYDDEDHAFALLRAERRPVELATAHGRLPGVLALPMLDQGALAGFLLVAAKPDDAGYRPDEVELLGWAAHQVGLDLQALHARDLEAQVVSLNETVARLSKGKTRLTAKPRTSSSLQQASSAG